MTAPFRSALAAAVLLAWAVWATPPAGAHGPDIPCGPVERGTIRIDGLTSDWDGVPALPLAVSPLVASAGQPLVAALRCNYDDQALYLLIDVEDDVLLRTPAAGPMEDHLELAFTTPGRRKDEIVAGREARSAAVIDRLLLWPASFHPRVPRVARWASGRPVRLVEGEGPVGRTVPLRGAAAIEVYETLRPKGYAVELRLPYPLVPGYQRGLPLPLAVRVVDGDSRSRPQVVALAETSGASHPDELSRIQVAEAQSGLTTLLAQLKLGPADLWWERTGDIGNGPARVLLLGRNLVTLSHDYGYQELAGSRDDVRDAQLVDLGDGTQAVLVRTVERGGGGSREVLRLWAMRGGRFVQLLCAEVGKQVGQSQLRTLVSLVKRGKATDVLLTPQPAVGFTAEGYQEQPAEDAQPILLPWRDKKARYAYRGGVYVRAD